MEDRQVVNAIGGVELEDDALDQGVCAYRVGRVTPEVGTYRRPTWLSLATRVHGAQG